MGRLAISPAAYRRVTFAAALALAFIVVTGGAVRLTGSGLGCPEWPNCEPGSLVPTEASDAHAMVEFVNRTVTGLVSVAVVLAVLGSLVRRPRRRDLTWLSLGLVAGVLGQIVLGGLTVLFELKPQFVMGHFLLSMVLLWNAVVLHHRAGQPDGPARPLVGRAQARLGRVLVVLAAAVVVTGTVVTASGPHGGDEEAQRFDLALPSVTRVHGVAVVLLVAAVAGALALARREASPASVVRSLNVLLGVILGQAVIGYVQYFNDVPALLVGLHIAGATAVWTAAVASDLALRTRGPVGAGTPAPPRVALAAEGA